MTPAETRAALVEAIAIALWRLDHPEDDQFSQVAPNDWNLWPEDGRAASLAYETHSKDDYREQAATAIAGLSAKLRELGLKIVPVEATAAEDRVRHYVRMRDARPVRLDDEIHGIHKGTEWEASLYLADLRAMVSAAPVVLGGPDA